MKIKYTLHGEAFGFAGAAEAEIEGDDPGQITGRFHSFVAALRKSGFAPHAKQPEFVVLPDGNVLCPKHGCAMRKREKQGDEWWSHNMGTESHPLYCRGYPGKDSPGYDVPARRGPEREPGEDRDDEPPPPPPEPTRRETPRSSASPPPPAKPARNFGAGLEPAPQAPPPRAAIPSVAEVERRIVTAIQALDIAWELEQSDARIGPEARAPFVTHFQVSLAVAKKLVELGKLAPSELENRPGVVSPSKHAIARLWAIEPELVDDLIRRYIEAKHEQARKRLHLPPEKLAS